MNYERLYQGQPAWPNVEGILPVSQRNVPEIVIPQSLNSTASALALSGRQDTQDACPAVSWCTCEIETCPPKIVLRSMRQFFIQKMSDFRERFSAQADLCRWKDQ